MSKEPEIDVMPSEILPKDKRFFKLPNNEILFKPPFTLCTIGAIGSGKTSFVYSLVNGIYKNYWDEVIVVCGTIDSKFAWENVKQRNVLFTNTFDDDIFLDYMIEIEELQEKRKKENKFPLRILLLLDDIIFEQVNKHRIGTLEKLIMICRHLNISIILALQHTKMISPAMRNQIMFFVLMRLTKNDLLKVASEHSNLLSTDEFINMYNVIQSKGKFEFLIIDYKADMNNRFRHRFTGKIAIEDYKGK